MRITEQRRLKTMREVREQIPGRHRKAIQVVDIGSTRVRKDLRVATEHQTWHIGDVGATVEAGEQIEQRDLAFSDDTEVDGTESLERALGDRAHMRAA